MRKKHVAAPVLAIGALGVVFGDIGTSPLYALQALFGGRVPVSDTTVYGIISLVIWSLILVVSVKFVSCIMRADNEGEGGLMALIGLIKNSKLHADYKWFFVVLGLIGVSLFYGDSAITPAISVLSAMEGLKVVTPHLSSLVLPLTIGALIGLFLLQKYGTAVIGWLFGPVMLTWFAVIGLGGALQIWHYPDALKSLLPWTAIHFIVVHPLMAFISLTAVVLAITGVEALYADMGHFGRLPITKAWFWIVFPALCLCYMGEGALILHNADLSGTILVQLFPAVLRIPVIILSAAATLIASQSVISGAFSLTSQAVQLKLLPRMLVRHTSDQETGQIYMPFINFMLFVMVVALVLGFRSSDRLAGAYGIAVSGTIAIDTLLFLAVMRSRWQKPAVVVALMGLLFVPIDFLFISSNTVKILHGGLFPIIVGCVIFLIFDTWIKGQSIVSGERRATEGTLSNFIHTINSMKPALRRIPGAAVYISHHPEDAPLALHATVSDLHELPEKVVIVSVDTTTTAHVPAEERAEIDNLDYNDGITHLHLKYGYHDVVNIPKALEQIRHVSPELNFNPKKAAYFISQGTIEPTKRHNMAGWRKSLYVLMHRNSLSASEYYKLPTNKTEVMQSIIKL